MSRLLAVGLGAIVVLAGVYALSQVFVARDDAGVASDAPAGPGTLERDRGAEHGSPATPRRTGDPPTSGPHQPALVPRDARALADDQLLHALELGNVVLVYPDPRPPPALRALQRDVSGPFDAELAAAGQSVLLVRDDRTEAIQALAWRRRLRARGPEDPALRAFAEAWLGKGVQGGAD